MRNMLINHIQLVQVPLYQHPLMLIDDKHFHLILQMYQGICLFIIEHVFIYQNAINKISKYGIATYIKGQLLHQQWAKYCISSCSKWKDGCKKPCFARGGKWRDEWQFTLWVQLFGELQLMVSEIRKSHCDCWYTAPRTKYKYLCLIFAG